MGFVSIQNGDTAVIVATILCHTGILQKLIKAQANLDYQNAVRVFISLLVSLIDIVHIFFFIND